MRWSLGVAGGLVWAAAVFGAYFASHKPVEVDAVARIPTAIRLLGHPWHPTATLVVFEQIVVAFAVFASAWLMGRLLVPLVMWRSQLGWSTWSYAEHLVAATVGLGTLAVMVLAIGLAGWLHPLPLAAVLVIPLLLTVGVEARRLKPVGAVIQSSKGPSSASFKSKDARSLDRAPNPVAFRPGTLQDEPFRPLDWALLAYAAAAVGLTMVAALTPPTGWDGLVYHLMGPKLYLEQGRIVPGLDGVHFYFPPLFEMLYLVGMALAGDMTPQIVHAFALGLAAIAVYGLASEELGRRAGLLAGAIFLSAPTWLLLGAQPYVDAGLALYVTLAFWSMRRWSRTDQSGWLVLSAILTGFALGIKYTSAFFVVGLAVAFFLTKRPLAFRSPVRWGLIAGLVAAPWYLKNAAFTGNPVYPFLFGGLGWDSWRTAWFGQPGTGLLSEPIRLLLVPWEMTILGGEGRIEYQATIGPLLLAAMPFALPGRRPTLVTTALIFFAAVFALWLVGLAEAFPLRQTRLIMPAFGVLAVAAAWGIQRLERLARPILNPRRVAMVLVLMTLALTLAGQMVGILVQMPLAPILGAENRDAYLARTLAPHYPAMQELQRETPPNARVYFLWEPRSYYAERTVLADQLLDNWTRPLHRYGSPEHIWRWLRDQGYTHVLLYRGGLDYLLRWQHGEITVEQTKVLIDFERSYLRRLSGPPLELTTAAGGAPALVMTPGGDYALYAIR